MDIQANQPLDWEILRKERRQLQRAGQRIPYISFALIHLALACFLLALFLVDRLSLIPVDKAFLRIVLVGIAIFLLALAWGYAVILSYRFKHVVKRWQQMEVAYQQQEQLGEMKEQFLIHVSHELRTPLTELQGFLELLLSHDHELDEETRAHFLNAAMTGCGELIALVNTMLDAIQIASNPPTHLPAVILPVEPLVRDLLSSFSSEQNGAHSIKVEIAEETNVLADEPSLRQVLRNLFSNAFKY